MASSTRSSELAGYGPPEDVAGAHALDGYGPPEPIDDARPAEAPGHVTPPVHSFLQRGMRPDPKSDAELGIDDGPKFFRGTPALLFADTKSPSGRFVANAKDAPGTEAYASHHAGDEMNDPGAQMITGAALAAPLSAAAPAALAPAVSGAQQSAFQGQNPAIGAALGALPSAPGAVRAGARAVDAAIGEAALRSATKPSSAPGPIAKAIEHAIGAGAGGAIGHATGIPGAGYAGAAAGSAAAGAVRQGISELNRKIATSLASRRLGQLAADAEPSAVREVADKYAARSAVAPSDPDLAFPEKLVLNPLPPVSARPAVAPSSAPSAPRSFLSPLKHEPLPPPADVPPGAFEASPPGGDFDALPTGAKGHATVGDATAKGGKAVPVAEDREYPPATLDQLREFRKNAKGAAAKTYDAAIAAREGEALRQSVAADAKKFRNEPYDHDVAPKGYPTEATANTSRPDLSYGAEPAPSDVGGQLAQSAELLDLMRQAKAAGTLKPEMIRSAVKLGMPHLAVSKAVGRETFEAAMGSGSERVAAAERAVSRLTSLAKSTPKNEFITQAQRAGLGQKDAERIYDAAQKPAAVHPASAPPNQDITL